MGVIRRQQPEYNIDEVRASIQTIIKSINGHGSLQGYSTGGGEYIVRGTQRPNLSKYASV